MRPIASSFLGICLSLVCCHANGSEFACNYVKSAHQLWFTKNLDNANLYRVYVVAFDADGKPEREIAAGEARYTSGTWTIQEGREIIFDRETLMGISAKIVSGNRPDLSFDPRDTSGRTSKIDAFGRGYLYASKSMFPSYSNASFFEFNERSLVVSYCFANEILVSDASGTRTLIFRRGVVVTHGGGVQLPRVSMYGELDYKLVDKNVPNHSPDPTPAPGMPPAGQESRHS